MTFPTELSGQPQWSDELLSDRFEVVPNRQTNPPVHGEKILTGELLVNMIDVCGSVDNDCKVNPIVFVYSHYIPCSNVLNTPDECASWLPDWLKNYNNNNPGRNANMVVGYLESFVDTRTQDQPRPGRTNEHRSLWYMYIGGIPAFKFDNNDNCEKQIVYSPRYAQMTVQGRMYDCLIGIHMEHENGELVENEIGGLVENEIGGLVFFDSNANGCVTGSHPQLMFSYYINYMMYECSRHHNGGNTNRDVMRRCTKYYINQRIDSKCPERGGSGWRKYEAVEKNREILRRCADWAIDTAQFYGVPSDSTTYGLSHKQLFNIWPSFGDNLRVDEPGVFDRLHRELISKHVHGPQWSDSDHDSRLVACVSRTQDLKLLCSEKKQNGGQKRRGSGLDDEGPSKKIKT